MQPASSNASGRGALTRFAWLSIATAVATIVLKLVAYWLTDSVGLLSDALESFVIRTWHCPRPILRSVMHSASAMRKLRPRSGSREYGVNVKAARQGAERVAPVVAEPSRTERIRHCVRGIAYE